MPLNLFDATAVDKVKPCDTVAKPAVINAAPVVAVELGVNAILDTMATTVSFVTIFKIDLFTPVLSCTVSVVN